MQGQCAWLVIEVHVWVITNGIIVNWLSLAVSKAVSLQDPARCYLDL